jgi:hypothetical protein
MRAFTKIAILACGAAAISLVGCGDAGQDAASVVQPRPDVTIEESDIYRVVGKTLYLHNEKSGLNIVDLSDPTSPRLLSRASVVGRAGELYVRDGVAVVLLQQGTRCGHNQAEVVLVDIALPRSPAVRGRYCLSGGLVTSRLIGDFLVAIIDNAPGTVAVSVDISDVLRPVLADNLELRSATTQVHVTSSMLYAVGASDGTDDAGCGGWCDPQPGTLVQMISFDPGRGRLSKRGRITLQGRPQGRFHMDARHGQFRIVTYDGYQAMLAIVDVVNPDTPRVTGKIDVGYPGEQLYATRFDGDRAYVVTYRETDPLWVVDLADPYRPTIVGELHLPGWSDFIYPMGDKLVAVGRGDRGMGIGVTLFDVANPKAPRVLTQLTLGDWSSQSEANVDHRAVTILQGAHEPMVLVPYSVLRTQYDSYENSGYGPPCSVENRLHLIKIKNDRLVPHGAVSQRGRILRSFVAEGGLYSLSTHELLSLYVTRDQLTQRAQLTLGDSGTLRSYEDKMCGGGMLMHDDVVMFCSVQKNAPVPVGLGLLALLFLALRWRRAV